MKQNNRSMGAAYEEKAAAYLINNQMKVVVRNYRCPLGEIDIIARDHEKLCFVEVKYRKSTKAGYPAEAVGKTKQQRIINTAMWFLKEQHVPENQPCRFDVCAILGDEIEYIKNAFGAF